MYPGPQVPDWNPLVLPEPHLLTTSKNHPAKTLKLLENNVNKTVVWSNPPCPPTRRVKPTQQTAANVLPLKEA